LRLKIFSEKEDEAKYEKISIKKETII